MEETSLVRALSMYAIMYIYVYVRGVTELGFWPAERVFCRAPKMDIIIASDGVVLYEPG